MAIRVGLGPVFAFEWRMASRRWQAYGLRSLTVLLLLGAMTPVWLEWPEAEIARQGELARVFYEWTSMIVLGLVGLAAPAATAGAICQDKSRGGLAQMLVTDLSDAEIVLGKLAARLVPVLGMILGVAPVLAIATLLGGLDPVDLIGCLLVVFSCAIFGCSLALTLSVWGRKTHEVLMATYVIGILYMLSAPLYAGIRAIVSTVWWPPGLPSFVAILRYNPIVLVLSTFSGGPPGMAPVTIETRATFLGMGLAASAVLLFAATWRIRSVVVRELGQEGRVPARRRLTQTADSPRPAWLRRLVRRAWPGPSLDRNPVLWRECQRKSLSRWNLAVWGVYILFCAGSTAYTITEALRGARSARDLGSFVNALQVGAGLLLLSASAATSLAEERQRGSLDVLMATPLPTRAIVWGKWWGTFRGVPPLVILPMAIATALSFQSERVWGVALLAALIMAYGAAITSLGLALATWNARLGRAAALTVGLYTLMSIGWIPFSMIVFGEGPGDNGYGVGVGSPLFGVRMYTARLGGEGMPHEFVSQALWTGFWTIAYAGIAIALLLATLATFNRCLGRIDEASIFDEDRVAVRPRAPQVAEVQTSPPFDLAASDPVLSSPGTDP